MKKFPLAALLTANAISMVGNVFAMIAIPWFVLQTTGSPAQTGLTGFFTTLAAVVATFFGGAIVDRLGFKRTSVIADVTSAVAFALIPLLYALGVLQYPGLLALVFVGNFLDAPGTTAREALIPDLAGVAGISLERASALIQAVERGARMVGAPLAGVIIAVAGARNAIWFDAGSFLVSAVIVWLLVPALKIHAAPAAVEAAAHSDSPRRYLAEIREGIDFILRDRLLMSIVLMVVVSNFIDTPYSGVLLPVYFQRFFGSAVPLGLVLSASGGGALVTALLFGAVGQRISRRAVYFGGFLLATVRFFVFALVPPVWALVVTALITGFGSGPINPVISTVSYERIPPQFRGRVLGALTSLAYVAMPLGSALGGLALQVIDIRVMLVGLGAAYVATILISMTIPAMRQMDVRPSASVEK